MRVLIAQIGGSSLGTTKKFNQSWWTTILTSSWVFFFYILNRLNNRGESGYLCNRNEEKTWKNVDRDNKTKNQKKKMSNLGILSTLNKENRGVATFLIISHVNAWLVSLKVNAFFFFYILFFIFIGHCREGRDHLRTVTRYTHCITWNVINLSMNFFFLLFLYNSFEPRQLDK